MVEKDRNTINTLTFWEQPTVPGVSFRPRASSTRGTIRRKCPFRRLKWSRKKNQTKDNQNPPIRADPIQPPNGGIHSCSRVDLKGCSSSYRCKSLYFNSCLKQTTCSASMGWLA